MGVVGSTRSRQLKLQIPGDGATMKDNLISPSYRHQITHNKLITFVLKRALKDAHRVITKK